MERASKHGLAWRDPLSGLTCAASELTSFLRTDRLPHNNSPFCPSTQLTGMVDANGQMNGIHGSANGGPGALKSKNAKRRAKKKDQRATAGVSACKERTACTQR